MEPTQSTQKSEFETHLNACQYFLLQRNFPKCHKYAIKANELDPNHSTPPQIRDIAQVLMHPNIVNEHPNYYSVLRLPNYSCEQRLMLSNFNNVMSSLNPDVNQYPFAREAFKVVSRAWSVLSSPTEKFRFDDGLRKVEKDRRCVKKRTRFDDGLKTNENGGSSSNPTRETRLDTFWTMCPYCYYLYEYSKDYEGCSLRCQYERCKRVLHALPIVGPPPPPEVAEKGEGKSVLGTEGKSFRSPFGMNKKDDNEIIEISDDEVEEDKNAAKEESLGVAEELVKNNENDVEVFWGDDDDIFMHLQGDFGMGAQDIGTLFS